MKSCGEHMFNTEHILPHSRHFQLRLHLLGQH
nr:MAG TPA: hypothetical protein [Caudoviricetes sp.]